MLKRVIAYFLILVSCNCEKVVPTCQVDAGDCLQQYLPKCNGESCARARLCCWYLSCGGDNQTQNYNFWNDELNACKSGIGPYTNLSGDFCDDPLLQCCTVTQGFQKKASGNLLSIQDYSYPICDGNLGVVPTMEMLYSDSRSQVQWNPYPCPMISGCFSLSLIPKTQDENAIVSAIITVRTLSSGVVSIVPYNEPYLSTSLNDEPVLRNSTNDEKLVMTAVKLSSSSEGWKFRLGCAPCGKVQIESKLMEPKRLIPSLSYPIQMEDVFSVHKSDWPSGPMIVLSCNGLWPQVKEYYPRTCKCSSPGLPCGLETTRYARLDNDYVMSWALPEGCESVTHLILQRVVPSPSCTVTVSSTVDITGDIMSILIMSILSILLLIGCIISIKRLNECGSKPPGPLPPNVFPMEGNSDQRRQLQLSLRPDPATNLGTGQLGDRLAIGALAMLLAIMLSLRIFSSVEVVLSWLPMLIASTLVHFRHSVFTNHSAWPILLAGIGIGCSLGFADSCQYRILNTSQIGPYPKPAPWRLDTDNWPNGSQIYTFYSYPGMIVEMLLRAVVISIVGVLAQLHIFQRVSINHRGVQRSVYDVTLVGLTCGASIGASSITASALLTMIVGTIERKTPTCILCDPWVCVPVKVLSAWIHAPVALLLALQASTSSRQSKTYRNQIAESISWCTLAHTALNFSSNLCYPGAFSKPPFAILPLSIFVVIMSIAHSIYRWRKIFWPHIIAPRGDDQMCEQIHEDIPQQLVCPLSGELMEDPFMTVPCAHHFERLYIMGHLAVNPSCPVCEHPVTPQDLLPSPEMRAFIAEWRAGPGRTVTRRVSTNSRNVQSSPTAESATLNVREEISNLSLPRNIVHGTAHPERETRCSNSICSVYSPSLLMLMVLTSLTFVAFWPWYTYGVLYDIDHGWMGNRHFITQVTCALLGVAICPPILWLISLLIRAHPLSVKWTLIYPVISIVLSMIPILVLGEIYLVGGSMWRNGLKIYSYLWWGATCIGAMAIEEAWKAYWGRLAIRLRCALDETIVLITVAISMGWAIAQQIVIWHCILILIPTRLIMEKYLLWTYGVMLLTMSMHIGSGLLIGLQLNIYVYHPDPGWPILLPIVLRLLLLIGALMIFCGIRILFVTGTVLVLLWLLSVAFVAHRKLREIRIMQSAG